MIPVRNIYYMLAYAFRALDERGWGDFDAEKFDNAADLCAAILCRGVGMQLKRGLRRDYLDRTEALFSPKGKIRISESLRMRSLMRHQVVCTWDVLTIDTDMNRIVKSTMLLLLRSDAANERKHGLRRLLAYFEDVGEANLNHVDWGMHFNRTTRGYRMIIGVCWLVCNGLIQGREAGETRLLEFADDQKMSHLYERFVLEYYKREWPRLKAGSPHIKWALDDGEDASLPDLLPIMKSDVVLAQGNDVLIIDCKYYTHDTQSNWNRRTVHSHNLYQIFTYVKNEEAALAGSQHVVAGMLLYAKTDDEIQPDATYQMSGNEISVKTLDLSKSFEGIRAQLDAIAESHFPEISDAEACADENPR